MTPGPRDVTAMGQVVPRPGKHPDAWIVPRSCQMNRPVG